MDKTQSILRPTPSGSGYRRFAAAALLYLIPLAPTLAQQTYYVATDGDNSHSGLSTTQPFQTIQHALTVVQPGDTLLLRGGTYREHLETIHHGTPSQPITIAAYSNELPVIKGSHVVTGWVQHTGAIWRAAGWTNRSQQVMFDGKPLQQIGLPINPFVVARGLDLQDMVAGSYFHNPSNNTLYVWLPSNQNPNHHLIEAGAGDDRFVFLIGRHYMVRGIHVQHSNVLGQWPGVILGEHSTLIDSSVTYMNYIGVYMRSHARIERCFVAHNGAAGINADFASNVFIVANHVISNNYRGADASMMAAGIRTYAASSYTIASNYVAHNLANGIWSDFCRDGSLKVIHANTIAHTRSHPARPDNVPVALFIEVSQNVLAANNLLIDNEVIGISIAESDDVDVVNNTIIGTRGLAALHGRTMPRWMPATHFETNNTVWASLRRNRIFNNLVYGGSSDYDLYWNNPSTNQNMVIEDNWVDFNLYYRPNAHSRYFAAQAFSNLHAFTQSTGMETHGFNQDPRLSSPESGDYRLSFLSVALDAGYSSLPPGMPDDDHDGEPRLLFERPDIGSFEFNGSAEAIAPMIAFTSPCGLIPYDQTGFGGINNVNVTGTLWAEVLDLSTGITNRYPVQRLTEFTWRVDAFSPLPLHAYEITVFGTNLNGTEAWDACLLERGDIGTGIPRIDVTNAPPSDILESTYVISGTNNLHVTGFLPWQCVFAGEIVATGTIIQNGIQWEATITGMQTGHNFIVITGTNAWGESHSVTTRIHSGETPIHYVSTNAPNPLYPFTSWETAAPTIMAALDAASDGDTVLVGPGVYRFGGRDHPFGYSRVVIDKAITLESTDGPDATVIWGFREGGPVTVRGVLVDHPDAVVRGFTIRNGKVQGYPEERTYGGGLLAVRAARIEQCHFVHNSALPNGIGGGAALMYVNGIIDDCVFQANQAMFGGGLAVLWGQFTTAHRLLAVGNFAANSGGGFLVDNTHRFANAVAWSNQAALRGGGIALANNAIVRNLTLEQNSAGQGGAMALIGNYASAIGISAWSNHPSGIVAVSNHLMHVVRNSILPGQLPAHWVTQFNLDKDPRYADPETGNFRLTESSPGMDRGLSAAWLRYTPDMDGLQRLVGPNIDIGAYEFWQQFWLRPVMTGYVAGVTNRLDIHIQWTPDRSLFLTNLTVVLPPDWTLLDAELGGTPLITHGMNILVDQIFTNSSTNMQARVVVPPDAIDAHTVAVEAAGALVKGEDGFPWSGISSPFIVHPYQWLELTPSGAGSVSSSYANGWAPYHQYVTVSAQAAPGWRFRGWLGDTANATTNSNGSLVFIMDRDRSVQADFVELVLLSIHSEFGGVAPPPGIHVFDRGTRVNVSARTTTTNLGRTYVVADWIGDGSLPTGGMHRAFSFIIDSNSSLIWRWCEVGATHRSRGYRTQGTKQSLIQIDLFFDSGANIENAWYRPTLPDGATIIDALGPFPVSASNNVFLVKDGLSNGQARIELMVEWPPETRGPIRVQGQVGVNALPEQEPMMW
ncbi:MAG TPA: right-handed parallel beta-helix repeat-containing protein [Kiritimatiellia bacterium]|nr:right-handed parallel beta-helix repeat-containing protein [Kiritimatiellia bacterium]